MSCQRRVKFLLDGNARWLKGHLGFSKWLRGLMLDHHLPSRFENIHTQVVHVSKSHPNNIFIKPTPNAPSHGGSQNTLPISSLNASSDCAFSKSGRTQLTKHTISNHPMLGLSRGR